MTHTMEFEFPMPARLRRMSARRQRVALGRLVRSRVSHVEVAGQFLAVKAQRVHRRVDGFTVDLALRVEPRPC